MQFTRRFARLCAFVCLSAIHARAVSQGTPASQPAPASDVPDWVQPTVTPEMGDPGGKLFGKTPDPAKVHHYYLAAEPELWDFTPQGADPICGRPITGNLLLNRTAWKIRYVQYADADFHARILPKDRLGILGPVLRGMPGEYLAVTLLNRSWRPVSIHPHGLVYDKDNQGSYVKPNPGLGAAIAPGARFTYVWQIDEESAPRPDEPSSKAWLYHSHVVRDEEVNLGMIGFIVVTDPARARPDGTPNDVDREMAALFTIFNESNMPDEVQEEPDERPADGPTGPVQRTWAEIQQFTQEGERHTINGLTFGNLQGLAMNEGERVRWYLFGLGSEKDFHTAHWHGARVVEDGRRRTDVVELLPASMKIADMHAKNPGAWLLHCHVADHMENGMYAPFVVHPADKPAASTIPADAFFGLPQKTFHLENVELTMNVEKPDATEVCLRGEVTVPTPFPVALAPFEVRIGKKSLTFRPDGSGLAASPEGLLLVKNASAYGNGNVIGGRLDFEVTLKGAGWLAELGEMHLLDRDHVAPGAELPVNLRVGKASHSAVAVLTLRR